MMMVLTKLQWGVKLQWGATSFIALLTRSCVVASFPARCYKEGINSSSFKTSDPCKIARASLLSALLYNVGLAIDSQCVLCKPWFHFMCVGLMLAKPANGLLLSI